MNLHELGLHGMTKYFTEDFWRFLGTGLAFHCYTFFINASQTHIIVSLLVSVAYKYLK